MIPGEVVEVLQHALQKLHPGIWYVVDDINAFNPSFGKLNNLSPFQYNNLLWRLSGILSRCVENYRFHRSNLDTIRIILFARKHHRQYK
jgi:hypothetical protein